MKKLVTLVAIAIATTSIAKEYYKAEGYISAGSERKTCPCKVSLDVDTDGLAFTVRIGSDVFEYNLYDFDAVENAGERAMRYIDIAKQHPEVYVVKTLQESSMVTRCTGFPNDRLQAAFTFSSGDGSKPRIAFVISHATTGEAFLLFSICEEDTPAFAYAMAQVKSTRQHEIAEDNKVQELFK